MEITQIVIVTSIAAITSIIVASGFYLIKILKELKDTVSKTNQILDDAKIVSQSVAEPVNSLSEFIMSFKNVFEVANKYFNRGKQKPSEKEKKSEESHSKPEQPKSITPKTFFKPKK
jgi:Na+-transporting NADH:ubiquinone oxidoreductase subunit NqrC